MRMWLENNFPIFIFINLIINKEKRKQRLYIYTHTQNENQKTLTPLLIGFLSPRSPFLKTYIYTKDSPPPPPRISLRSSRSLFLKTLTPNWSPLYLGDPPLKNLKICHDFAFSPQPKLQPPSTFRLLFRNQQKPQHPNARSILSF